MKNGGSDFEARREHAFERLGSRTPNCMFCDETDPFALTGTYPDVLCYEHRVRAFEGQHPPGQHNADVAMRTRGNDHRIWDEAKKDWPDQTLKNPHGDPLLKIAATARSLLDWFRLLVERLLGWIPEFCERLSDALRRRHGDRWWDVLGLEAPR